MLPTVGVASRHGLRWINSRPRSARSNSKWTYEAPVPRSSSSGILKGWEANLPEPGEPCQWVSQFGRVRNTPLG